MVDAADLDAVAALLQCSKTVAYNLTAEARALREAATKSIAMQLIAMGLSQRQVAAKLGVEHVTVGRWVEHFSGAEKCSTADPRVPAAVLDQIAEDIRAHARAAVRPEVLEEARAEVEADFKARLAKLTRETKEAIKKQRIAHDARLAELEAQIAEITARQAQAISEAEQAASARAAAEAVKELLACSRAKAFDLTQAARNQRDAARLHQIVELRAKGASLRQIAERVGLDSHVSVKNILDALGYDPRTGVQFVQARQTEQLDPELPQETPPPPKPALEPEPEDEEIVSDEELDRPEGEHTHASPPWFTAPHAALPRPQAVATR